MGRSFIASTYSLTVKEIEKLNGNTWGWNGCKLLWVGVKLCVSPGSPPMPASVSVG